MKTLFLIGGTMGVGKTTVCEGLNRQLEKSVFLDGDWCWNSNPFQVNDETKKMVLENIAFLLNQFIKCQSFENIIFAWVMHEQTIIDTILSMIDITDCDVKIISLVCDEKALINRLRKDIKNGKRKEDIIKRSVERLPLYKKLNTTKIDTTNKSINEIVMQLAQK